MQRNRDHKRERGVRERERERKRERGKERNHEKGDPSFSLKKTTGNLLAYTPPRWSWLWKWLSADTQIMSSSPDCFPL